MFGTMQCVTIYYGIFCCVFRVSLDLKGYVTLINLWYGNLSRCHIDVNPFLAHQTLVWNGLLLSLCGVGVGGGVVGGGVGGGGVQPV